MAGFDELSDVKGEEGLRNGRAWCTGSVVLPCRSWSRYKLMNSLLHVLSLRLLCVIPVEVSGCDLRLNWGMNSFVECLLCASCFTYKCAAKNRHSSCPTLNFLRRGQRYLVTKVMVVMTRTIKHISQRPNCRCIH